MMMIRPQCPFRLLNHWSTHSNHRYRLGAFFVLVERLRSWDSLRCCSFSDLVERLRSWDSLRCCSSWASLRSSSWASLRCSSLTPPVEHWLSARLLLFRAAAFVATLSMMGILLFLLLVPNFELPLKNVTKCLPVWALAESLMLSIDNSAPAPSKLL